MDLFGEIIQSVFLTEGIATVSNVNDAINNLTPVEIRYTPVDPKNKAVGRRIIFPVAYGLTTAGNPVVRAFEPYGDTDTKVPAWKFFLLSGIRHWRPLSKQTFKGKKLEGFNPDNDKSMSVVYNIANIEGKPKNFKPTDVKVEPVTKSDISPKAQEKEIEKETQPDKLYTSAEIIDDMLKGTQSTSKTKIAKDDADDALQGIKKQLEPSTKQMASPEQMAEIEKSNARRKLAQARKQGIKLDNEQELLDIIKGKPANRMMAPKTKPITKKDIISQGKPSTNTQPQNIPTKPVYKKDFGKTYQITSDDVDKIKKQWGIK